METIDNRSSEIQGSIFGMFDLKLLDAKRL